MIEDNFDIAAVYRLALETSRCDVLIAGDGPAGFVCSQPTPASAS
jgi:hypothetical protein